MMLKRFADIEIRESAGVSRLHLTMIQEGRIASGLAELFSPGSVRWDADGVAVRVGHGSPAELRAMPVRRPDGRIQISARATARIIEAVNAGNRGASVEFYALREARNGAGVREIRRALVEGVAIVKSPEYSQGKAELRNRNGRRRIWL